MESCGASRSTHVPAASWAWVDDAIATANTVKATRPMAFLRVTGPSVAPARTRESRDRRLPRTSAGNRTPRVRLPLVGEPHRRAHVAHRLARHRARPLGADLDDPVHPLRVGQVRRGALPPRLLLGDDRVDQRL